MARPPKWRRRRALFRPLNAFNERAIGTGLNVRRQTGNGKSTMKKCLIVDDSKVIRMVARKILEELRFIVSEAEDGKLALEACQAEMPDGILLDWNMPVMSGLEFLQQLRAMPDVKQPVVVFCTTENDMAHIQKAIEAGANEYIMKPFDSEILESKFIQVGLL